MDKEFLKNELLKFELNDLEVIDVIENDPLDPTELTVKMNKGEDFQYKIPAGNKQERYDAVKFVRRFLRERKPDRYL